MSSCPEPGQPGFFFFYFCPSPLFFRTGCGDVNSVLGRGPGCSLRVRQLSLSGPSWLFLLLHQAACLSLPPSLAGAGRPTPSWLAQPVFVIVDLALSQGWLRARLVGTVCTVSAQPSLSSYAIIIFFFIFLFFLIWKGWGGNRSFCDAGGENALNSVMLFL